MSLTLPSAYSSASKTGNISENWLVHLGFFNGEADGSGEGGWDSALQSDGSNNTVDADPIPNQTTTTSIDVLEGDPFKSGDLIRIDDEIMLVSSATSSTVTVRRGQHGTIGEVGNHADSRADILWNNYIPLAMSNTTVDDVFHHGVITNKPSIRTSLDLSKSVAKTGNITLDLVNFEYRGDDFSAELLFGTRKYINRSVRIYSQLNGETALANCLQIYQGRLVDISHDASTIRLQITEQRPWDFITIPQDKSPNNIYIPVVYGGFTGNASSDFCANKTLFPAPQESLSSENCYYIAPRSLNNASGNETSAHWYERGLDRFIPINNTVTSTLTDGDSELVIFPTLMERTFKFRPVRVKSDNDWTTPENAFDTNATTYAHHTVSGTGALTSSNQYLMLELAELTGLCTAITLTIAGKSQISDEGNPPGEWAQSRFQSFGLDLEILNFTSTGGGPGAGSDTTSGFSGKNMLSTYQGNGNILDEIKIQSTILINSGGNGYAATNQIKDIQFLATVDLSDPDATAAQKSNNSRRLLENKLIYLGCDGLTNSFSGGSGTVTAGLQMHRDLLARFTNYDEADSSIYNWDDSYPANTDSGSDLAEDLDDSEPAVDVDDGDDFQINDIIEVDTEKMLITNISTNTLTVTRGYLGTTADTHSDNANVYIVNSLCAEDHRITTAWSVRWWALEPIDLDKVLQQVQREFAFIFKWRADGSGSYWVIKDKYSSNDVAQTFKKDDIANLEINNTPFSELLTKMEVSYEKHPAESRYLSTLTSEDSTNDPRQTWDIKSKENVADVKLSMNVDKPGNANPGGGNSNDGYADYYMNIFGDIKKIISFSVVNPAKGYNLETGDIIQFSNTAGEMPVDPFGDNWADYYCITSMGRSPGKINITVREVA